MPILNADDDVVGVAQVINKNGTSGGFNQDDEKVYIYIAKYSIVLKFLKVSNTNKQMPYKCTVW